MRAMAALVVREWQEHVVGFFWAPVAVLIGVVLITCLGVAVAEFGTATVHYSSEVQDETGINRRDIEIDESLSTLSRFIDYGAWSDTELAGNMSRFRNGVARPFEYIYLLIAIFVLLGALYEERRDRSVLFWKSMPVTDTESVLGKLIAVAWAAPAAVIAAIVVAQVFLMIVISGVIWAQELGSIGRLWWHSGLLAGTAELIVGYAVQGLWALPLYAWLLAVSAAVPRVPFVWATLVPLGVIVIESVVVGTQTVRSFVIGHAQLAALPGSADRAGTRQVVGLPEQLSLIVSTQLWLGLLVGAALLWVAVYFRRRNNDL
jgi:ABC-2 type transport system permease protein